MGEFTDSSWEAFENAWHALRMLMPIVMVGVFFLLLLVIVAHPSTSSLLGITKHSSAKSAPIFGMLVLYGAMFGTIGALVGVLFSISERGAFESYIPHLIVVLTVLFQLMGRLRSNWSPPLESLPTIIGTTTAAFVFLFTIIYLHEIGFRDKFQPTPSVEASSSK